MARHAPLAALALLALLAGASAYGEDGSGQKMTDKSGPGPRPGPPHPGPPGPDGPHGPHCGPPPPQMVCKDDFWRFCAFRIPDMKNMEDIVKCLDAHKADLAPPCAEMVTNITATLAEFHAACDPSLTEVCPDAIGKPATAPCMAFNLDKMETVCLSKLSEIMKNKAAQHRPGPPGPHGPPHGGMDFFPEHGAAFVGDGELSFFEGEEMRGMRKNEHHFLPGFAGGVAAIVLFAAVMCVKRALCRRRCRNPHHPHHDHPHGPHHGSGPHPVVHPCPHAPVEVGKPTDYSQFQ
mmetsp:Transcript_50750/g.120875  ORF Transcript_50750/g.120875 Transcript_50750/m.120875 type:complete len:292 (+) Transcript_50750:35-910(+)